MPIIQCDIRRGRTEDQRSRMALGITKAVHEITGAPIESIFLVMREMPGFNFVDAGEHVPEYQAGPDGRDVAGEEQLRARDSRNTSA